jgi:hypothetical protein
MTNPETKLEMYLFVREVLAPQLGDLLPAAIGLRELLRNNSARETAEADLIVEQLKETKDELEVLLRKLGSTVRVTSSE